uniref:17-beta-hydroxysteroid dehydrogenase type 2 isoform X1 n=1 Tax=Centroberyx gerrardi TaxID=166262 RepID=UPI003AB077A6
MGNSDSGFCISTFCAIATAAYVYTVVRQVTEGCYAGCWAIALGTLGCPLYFWGCPGCCGLLLCCSLCLHYVTVGRRVEWLSMHGRAVLVTGCDSGFGHALAKQLSELGVTVFAGVLDASGPGAQRLKQHGSKHLQVLQLDVTDHSQIEQAHRYICAQVGEAGLWGLVNNAGILGYTADGEIQPITAYRRCMDVNFLSAVKMCQVFLPLLRSSRGRIVNISSMAGEVPIPMFSAYGASKAALGVFSSVMRLELAGWGVKVATIQPAGFRTSIFRSSEAGSRYQDELLNGLSSDTREDYGEAYISSVLDSPSKMADQLSDDLSPVVEDMRHALLSVHPKPLYSPGQTAWLFPFLYRLCPTAMSDFIIPRIFKFNDCHPAGLRMN